MKQLEETIWLYLINEAEKDVANWKTELERLELPEYSHFNTPEYYAKCKNKVIVAVCAIDWLKVQLKNYESSLG